MLRCGVKAFTDVVSNPYTEKADGHFSVYISSRVSPCLRQRSATCVLLQGVFDGDEVLQRFGHLAAGDGQVSSVQEVAHPAVVLKKGLDRKDNSETLASRTTFRSLTNPLSSAHLGLSQLVVMVGEAQVEAAAVDVHGLAEDGARHGRTLDVPPWSPLKSPP